MTRRAAAKRTWIKIYPMPCLFGSIRWQLTAEERATIFYVDGNSVEILRRVHALVKATKQVKAISEFENLALITIRGRDLEVIPGLIQKLSEPLGMKGINIYL